MNNMITKLQPNEIFIFGSNLKGHHFGGAAKQAFDDFGAEWGIGEGLTGQSYAFPTLDEYMQQLPKQVLQHAVKLLYKCATDNPDKRFYLTKVGCGIANYKESFIKTLFKGNRPKNILMPSDWE